MSSCGNTSLRSCLNISKARLDGRRAVWVGSPLTTEKGYANRKLFLALAAPIPILRIWRKWKHFLRRGFQSFHKRPDEDGLYCSLLRSAPDLPVKNLLEDFWLTTANTINPGDHISYVHRLSSYRRLRCVSSYCKSASSVSIIPGASICLDICLFLAEISHRQKCREGCCYGPEDGR